MKKRKITELLIFIIGTELVGALSGLLAGNSFSFYQELVKPPLAPPGWLFPVMWVILYALMGISVFLIYTSDAKGKTRAFVIYALQLFVNFMWPIVFFRFEMLGLSVTVILTLLVLLIVMLVLFYQIRPAAAYLNVPYLLWILFASYLNIGILLFN